MRPQLRHKASVGHLLRSYLSVRNSVMPDVMVVGGVLLVALIVWVIGLFYLVRFSEKMDKKKEMDSIVGEDVTDEHEAQVSFTLTLLFLFPHC